MADRVVCGLQRRWWGPEGYQEALVPLRRDARGLSAGLWTVSVDVAWPAYFGRRYLGTIRGFGFATGVAGAALGPAIFSVAYDTSGGYDAAIVGLLALPVLAAIAVLLTRHPALGVPPVRVMPLEWAPGSRRGRARISQQASGVLDSAEIRQI